MRFAAPLAFLALLLVPLYLAWGVAAERARQQKLAAAGDLGQDLSFAATQPEGVPSPRTIRAARERPRYRRRFRRPAAPDEDRRRNREPATTRA